MFPIVFIVIVIPGKYQELTMPSIQKCADHLREQSHKTLTPQIQAMEDELRDFSKLLEGGIRGIGYKLEALRNTEFPVTGLILDDYLKDVIRKRDLGGEALALFTRGLQTKETQEEILTSLLDNSLNYFPRAALFALRGNMLKGWSSRGFSDSTAGAISSDEFRQVDCPLLLDALINRNPLKSVDLPDSGSLRLMRNESTGVWRLYPLYVLGRPVAILIAGETEGFAGRPEELAVLMDCSALRLENITLKIIKKLNESAPENASANLFPSELSPDASPAPQPAAVIPHYVLNLNLTAPIEVPEPVEAADKSYCEYDYTRTNPLAGLNLVVRTPEPVNVLSLNLTAPIEAPAPVEAADKSYREYDYTRPNPLAGLKLAEQPPEPVNVLSLNLTAPIEVPEPVETADESYREYDYIGPNPLAGLKLAEQPPKPVDVLNLNLTAPIEVPEPVETAGISYREHDYIGPNPLAGLKLAEQPPKPVSAIPAAAASEHAKEAVIENKASAREGTPAVTVYERAAKIDPMPGTARPNVYVPPPPASTNTEDERLHTAAKRFAELLVSEIKFYNEDAVAEGRKKRDLYVRLHKNMTRSREMYEKRVAPTVAYKIDYLHEAFVRILGDGNAEVLGSGYPGSIAGETNRITRS